MPIPPMIVTVVRFSGCCAFAALAMAVPIQAQVHFSQAERERVMEFWSQPDRYTTGRLPDAGEKGSWRVRQTVEGSKWLWAYSRKLRPGKSNPNSDAKASTPQQAAWEAWIDQRIAYDYAVADLEAARKNEQELGRKLDSPALPSDPGPIPPALANLAGVPPNFACVVQPMTHQVKYEDGSVLNYTDYIPLRRRFQYFRFPEGIQSFGDRVKGYSEAELDSLFRQAGLSKSEMKIMRAVSLLEGGFDSINTYDTGFVSAGLIQFAALDKGAGSLGSVLLELKKSDYSEFDRAFRGKGLEVTDNGELVALCPTTGAEFTGPQAALKIISDRRLASVFQFAGKTSRSYRVAQLRVAKDLYYPGSQQVALTLDGRVQQVRVTDVFKSEAGLATLMDRKVNTGSLGPLAAVLQSAADRFGAVNPGDLALVEYELVQEMQYRKDYLADSTLSQPRDLAVGKLMAKTYTPRPKPLASRGTVRRKSAKAAVPARNATSKVAPPKRSTVKKAHRA